MMPNDHLNEVHRAIRGLDLNGISGEKVEYIERRVERLHEFGIESRAILNREAHTTLQWYFGLIVFSVGYLLAAVDRRQFHWPILAPVAAISLLSAGLAYDLIRNGLRARPVYPCGNEPQHLIRAGLETSSLLQTRLDEIANMQTGIEENRGDNRQVAAVLNRARTALATLPLVALAVGSLAYFCT